MKILYHAYAQRLCGSTDKIIDVYISSSDSKERAVELCEEYAKKHRHMIKTWLKKDGRSSEYCAKAWVDNAGLARMGL